jgi:transcriptional regulator with XRE-family HTH domain
MKVMLESNKRRMGKVDLGMRIKDLRTKAGLSQKDLAGMIGVTPSTISQFESNSIYPSVPVLFKIAQTLEVEVGSFFRGEAGISGRVVFKGAGKPTSFDGLTSGNLYGYRLSPVDFVSKAEPYRLEIPAGEKLSSHFFIHKGEELGYVLTGELKMTIDGTVYHAKSGDVIYLKADMPSNWENVGSEDAQMIWVKIK